MRRTLLFGLFCLFCGMVGARLAEQAGPPESVGRPGVSSQVSAAQPVGTAPARARAAENARPWAVNTDRVVVLTAEEQTNIHVYEEVSRSVVHINTRSVEVDAFFSEARESQGIGSGAVLDKAGHIITNFHVVDGARNIDVTLVSNQSYSARLIGKDKEHDIAVLRIEAPPEELFPIQLGASTHLRVGQRVYALGNPFGWDGTLTTGIVSSLNRDLPSRVEGRVMQSLIQTDAAMNPGNSGGPLLDTGARMIGMCVAIETRTGQNTGVGFAIPIDRIKQVLPDLIEKGHVVRADIGITHVMETNNSVQGVNHGLLVARLTPGGPADRAGLRGFRKVHRRYQQGGMIYETETIDRSHADRILAVDGEPMRTGMRFRDKIWEHKPGDQVTLTIIRDGRQMKVAVTLGGN